MKTHSNEYSKKLVDSTQSCSSFDVLFLRDYATESLHHLKAKKDDLTKAIGRAKKIYKGVKLIVSTFDSMFEHFRNFSLTGIISDVKGAVKGVKDLTEGARKEAMHKINFRWYHALQSIRCFLEWGDISVLEEYCKEALITNQNIIEVLAHNMGILNYQKKCFRIDGKTQFDSSYKDSFVFVVSELEMYHIDLHGHILSVIIKDKNTFLQNLRKIMDKQ